MLRFWHAVRGFVHTHFFCVPPLATISLHVFGHIMWPNSKPGMCACTAALASIWHFADCSIFAQSTQRAFGAGHGPESCPRIDIECHRIYSHTKRSQETDIAPLRRDRTSIASHLLRARRAFFMWSRGLHATQCSKNWLLPASVSRAVIGSR